MNITAKLLNWMGSDMTVVNAARVSFDQTSEELGQSGVVGKHMTPVLKDGDKRLIKYLAKHKHLSPFGHCFASFYVSCPIFVARQLVKHSYLRINEVSRRYIKSRPQFYEPEVWRGQAKDKKQGSSGQVDLWNDVDPRNPPFATFETFQHYQKLQVELYTSMLEAGVCEEQARMVLPANLITHFYWSGSLDAFAKMANLRCAGDSQYETRLVAQDISTEMAELFPYSWAALRSMT